MCLVFDRGGTKSRLCLRSQGSNGRKKSATSVKVRGAFRRDLTGQATLARPHSLNEVFIGYTSYDPTTLTTDFAKNANSGPMIPVVAKRRVLLPNMPSGAPISPQQFFLTICFDVPFTWVKRPGQNLLVEVRVHSNSNANSNFLYQFDAVNNDRTSRLMAWGNTTATLGLKGTNGLVMKFDDQKCAPNKKPMAYYELFGQGCAGTGGKPGIVFPPAARSGFGNLDGAFAMSTKNMRIQQLIEATELPSRSTKIISYAERKASWPRNHPGKSFPLELRFGMTTRTASTMTSNFATNAFGSTATRQWMPSDARLAGLQFHNQFAVFDPKANGLGLVWSNGATATLQTQ